MPDCHVISVTNDDGVDLWTVQMGDLAPFLVVPHLFLPPLDEIARTLVLPAIVIHNGRSYPLKKSDGLRVFPVIPISAYDPPLFVQITRREVRDGTERTLAVSDRRLPPTDLPPDVVVIDLGFDGERYVRIGGDR